MNNPLTAMIIGLLAVVALLSTWYVLNKSSDDFEQSLTNAHAMRIGDDDAELLYLDLAIYQLSAKPRAGSPLALEDFAKDDPSLCAQVRNWTAIGKFYFLDRVPPLGQPCAVYVCGTMVIPDVSDHPEWEISALLNSQGVNSR